MSIKGKVIEIHNHIAEIEILPDDKCKGCKGCFRSLEENKTYKSNALIPKDIIIKKDDTVNIQPTEPINEAFSSLLLFGLPLIGFVTVLYLSRYIINPESTFYDLFAFLLALIAGIIFTMPAIIYSRKIKKNNENKPQFIIVETSKNCCNPDKKIPQD